MGRKRVPGAAGGDPRRGKTKKRSPGLKVEAGGEYWYIRGTVRAAGRSSRIRQSTGLRASPENRDAADAQRLRIEQQFRDAVIHGKTPSVAVAIAADRYLAAKPGLKTGEKRKIAEVAARFAFDVIGELSDEQWNNLVDARHAGNKSETRERWLNTIVAWLNWCKAKPRKWLADMPAFERDRSARKPKHRRARRVAELTPELILFLASHAKPHMKGQIAVEWATGARVSSVLFGCRLCDYVAAPGREQITFHNTKNGEPVVAAVHRPAAALMAQYLGWRGNLHDREGALFLTHLRKPYSPKGKEWSSQNKNAFRGMKRRAMRALRIEAIATARAALMRGNRDAAAQVIAVCRSTRGLVRQVTQHWFRHALATNMMTMGGDGALRLTMQQGGWLDPGSVIGYTHDAPASRRELVNRIGGNLTGEKDSGEKSA